MDNKKVRTGLQAFFYLSMLLMLWYYIQGYNSSIGWEVTTSAEVIDYPAIVVEGELLDFTIKADNYLLTERYSGGQIERNRLRDSLFAVGSWIAVCVVLAASSFLKRIGFFIFIGLYALLINRLNLAELGLFGLHGPVAMLAPFAALAGPLFYFHEYRPHTPFAQRLVTIVAASLVILAFGIENRAMFLDHYLAHSLFTLSIAGLLFLFLVSEEIVFAILSVTTRAKGAKGNFRHFLILTLVYLVNLILYYLNKSGLVPNSFSFFDPFVLLAISCIAAYWTLPNKLNYFQKYFPKEAAYPLFFGLGIILFSVLGLAFSQGQDAIYEAYHYFILYFHIGFGVFFLLYLIINFIDPLLQGYDVYRFAYVEQHFPYVSARLGGLAAILGFYFLANQAPYGLLRSGYYSHLADTELTSGRISLAEQYLQQAGFLGYNTHYANYQLAWIYSGKGEQYLTKTHFEKATKRFPSPFAYVNYANLDRDINLSKVQATLNQAFEAFEDGEVANNQGLLKMQSEEWSQALELFANAESGEGWNQAPLINKWAVCAKLGAPDSTNLEVDYLRGNLAAKGNILLLARDSFMTFEPSRFWDAPYLHQQAFLLAALPVFEEDTLANAALAQLEASTDANFNTRLRKSLAVHYFNKGAINRTFKVLDDLQANSYQHQKGARLNEMGILALEVGSPRLALDYFNRAAEYDQLIAEVNRLEALAALGRQREIPDSLISILNRDPSLTGLANELLKRLESASFKKKQAETNVIHISDLSDDELIALASANAFAEEVVIRSIDELQKRDNLESYHVILEAIEINPYSAPLLKSYAMTALRQNLTSYAEGVLPRIKELSTPSDYRTFETSFLRLKEELENEAWGQ